jgi:hypothetical protein
MADNAGTLEKIAGFMGTILEPISARLVEGEIGTLFLELGYDFGDELDTATPVLDAASLIVTDAGLLFDALESLATLLEDEDYVAVATAIIDITGYIKGIIEAFQDLADALKAFEGSLTVADAAAFQAFVDALPKRLLDYLVITYLEDSTEGVTEALEFIDVVRRTDYAADAAYVGSPEYTERVLNLNQLIAFFSGPNAHLQGLYGWGNDTFDGVEMLTKLGDMLGSLGLPSYLDTEVDPIALDLFMVAISPNTTVSPPGLDITVQEDITASATTTFTADNYSTEIGMEASLDVEGVATIQPDGKITLAAVTGSAEGALFFKWTGFPTAGEAAMVIVGEADGSRLEAAEMVVEARVDLAGSAASAAGVWSVEAEITGGKLVIASGNEDGFLATLLPEGGIEIDFDFGMGYNSATGFYFKDSGQLEINLPVSLTLGPITISNLLLGLAPSADAFSLSLGADIAATIGPFSCIIEGIGITADIRFPEDRKGNMGVIDFAMGFKPPKGLGMSIDASGIKGGGYLFLDYEKGEYAGAIELSFQDSFALSAIGIITTKMPDGAEGYSLLILINVTWSTPLPLGLNFYFSGVGGLLGLHRTVDVDRMRQGVQDGSLDSILFPEDVIANITTIITDLQEAFPIQQDQFVVGVMARITWNTPALLTADLGLIIEFSDPVRILILGIIKLQLPSPDAAIVNIQVNFLGVIDFEAGMLSFDAEIFNSSILSITLEGSMALRISWGTQKDFLISIGGFHPSYTPPSYLDLPDMKRITINLLSGNPSLKLTAYFAVTTNTIQFGAALAFAFTVGKFGVYGDFGLDVIFIFSPFSFEASVHASLAVRWGDSDLLSVALLFTLSGPSPWRAQGYGEFKVLGIKCKVSFDTTFGEKKSNSLPDTEVLPLLLAEFEKDENWEAEIPDTRYDVVTYNTAASSEGALLVRPHGGIAVRQRILPLDMDFTIYGAYDPSDIKRAEIYEMKVGDVVVETEDLYDAFAPSAYKEMSDADKLAAPSYEDQKSGKEVVGTADIDFGYSINRAVKYDVTVSDYEDETSVPVKLGLQTPAAGMFAPFTSGGAIGRSALSQRNKRKGKVATSRVTIQQPQVRIATTSGLSAYAGNTTSYVSRAEADEQLKQIYAADPSLKGQLQLVNDYQLV